MGKGPGLFTDIGKKAKDLLTKDYIEDQKFTVTTETESGLVFTSTGIKKGGLFNGEVSTQLKSKNVTTDVKIDTNSKISTTVTAEDVAPGLKTVFCFTIPDQSSGKIEFQYHQEYAGISAKFGLTSVPLVEINGAFGSEGFAIGGEIGFDTSSGTLTKYNTGIGFTKSDFSASLILADKGDTLKASYLHTVSPITRSIIAAEILHKFSTSENTFTVGTLYPLDILTTVKACLNNHGRLAVLLQHEWRPKSLITLSGEMDTKALDRKAKVGLALVLKP
eukprot:c4058_g1_i1 orf=259-1089(+)